MTVGIRNQLFLLILTSNFCHSKVETEEHYSASLCLCSSKMAMIIALAFPPLWHHPAKEKTKRNTQCVFILVSRRTNALSVTPLLSYLSFANKCLHSPLWSIWFYYFYVAFSPISPFSGQWQLSLKSIMHSRSTPCWHCDQQSYTRSVFHMSHLFHMHPKLDYLHSLLQLWHISTANTVWMFQHFYLKCAQLVNLNCSDHIWLFAELDLSRERIAEIQSRWNAHDGFI